MNFVLKCFECREHYDHADEDGNCPECHTDNVATWNY